jgi:hypothetical protein
MLHIIKNVAVIGIFLSMLLLSACGNPAPTSTPTLDLNPFRTEIAATVLAQVSQELAMTPSVTPNPSSTATIPLPSTPTQTITASSTPQATLSSGTPGEGAKDQAEWVSQTITDGTIFAPGEVFTITWRLKNVGNSIWTASYLLRFYSGNVFGAPNELLLGRSVLPSQEIDISIPMKAPTNPGDYRSDWVLSNESRSNFKQPVFLKITVATPATPTPTMTPIP